MSEPEPTPEDIERANNFLRLQGKLAADGEDDEEDLILASEFGRVRMDERAATLVLLTDALAFVQANAWSVRHAAENTYCPACSKPEDLWRDQREHHDGCTTLALIARLEAALKP